jgi:hypothetical protein
MFTDSGVAVVALLTFPFSTPLPSRGGSQPSLQQAASTARVMRGGRLLSACAWGSSRLSDAAPDTGRRPLR